MQKFVNTGLFMGIYVILTIGVVYPFCVLRVILFKHRDTEIL